MDHDRTVRLRALVQRVVDTYSEIGGINRIGEENLPSQAAIVDVLGHRLEVERLDRVPRCLVLRCDVRAHREPVGGVERRSADPLDTVGGVEFADVVGQGFAVLVGLTVSFTTGWPQRRVALNDIEATSVETMSAVHGWGIRAAPGGWLWRAGGRRAVRLNRVSGRALIIGSDEPEALVAAIDSRRNGAPSTL